jgi:hypothetical protein
VHACYDLNRSVARFQEIVHAWEDIKAMFNGGTRKRMLATGAHLNPGAHLGVSSAASVKQSSAFASHPQSALLLQQPQTQPQPSSRGRSASAACRQQKPNDDHFVTFGASPLSSYFTPFHNIDALLASKIARGSVGLNNNINSSAEGEESSKLLPLPSELMWPPHSLPQNPWGAIAPYPFLWPRRPLMTSLAGENRAVEVQRT